MATRILKSVDVTHRCGCVNHASGKITFCPVHREAKALVAFVRRVTEQEPEPDGSRLLRNTLVSEARALLRRVDPA